MPPRYWSELAMWISPAQNLMHIPAGAAFAVLAVTSSQQNFSANPRIEVLPGETEPAEVGLFEA